MKKFSKILTLGLVAMTLTTTACSDDDDPKPNKDEIGKVIPERVFENGLPTQIGDMVITIGNNGPTPVVTKIVDGDEVTTFDYTGAKSKSRAGSRPTDYDVLINVTWGDDKDGVDLYAKLNDSGFIGYVFEEDETDEGMTTEEWWFKYNDKGQLIEMKRTEGDNEVTTITYNAAGDITGIKLSDDVAGQKMSTTTTYTNGTITSPIVNKSGIMLYDDCFRIDMDEMAPAYFAGLLGKGTAHLPLKTIEVSGGETYEYTFGWTFDSNNMPTSCTSTCKDQWGTNTDDPINFKWQYSIKTK